MEARLASARQFKHSPFWKCQQAKVPHHLGTGPVEGTMYQNWTKNDGLIPDEDSETQRRVDAVNWN